MPAVPRHRRVAAAAGLLWAIGSAGAHAQQLRLEPPPVAAPRLKLRLPGSPDETAQALKAQGIARTAFDHGFQAAGATASLGFLCGLAPAEASAGAAAARGVDHDGRFLGAQLRLGFR